MKRKVFRDKSGHIINIGPWDYRRKLVPVIADGTETVPGRAAIKGELLGRKKFMGEDGLEQSLPIFARGGETIPDRKALEGEMLGQAAIGEPENPLPAGAVEGEADIIVGHDGGLYEAGDPRAKGP